MGEGLRNMNGGERELERELDEGIRNVENHEEGREFQRCQGRKWSVPWLNCKGIDFNAYEQCKNKCQVKPCTCKLQGRCSRRNNKFMAVGEGSIKKKFLCQCESVIFKPSSFGYAVKFQNEVSKKCNKLTHSQMLQKLDEGISTRD